MSSRNEKMERSQASGIVRDSISGASFIPATQVKKSLEYFFSCNPDIKLKRKKKSNI